MAFSIQHRMGDGEVNPPLKALARLYDELHEAVDAEHVDVAVEHIESETCLIAYRSGLLVREDLATDRTRHLKDVPRDQVLELWKALAGGDLERIDREPWKDGYG